MGGHRNRPLVVAPSTVYSCVFLISLGGHRKRPLVVAGRRGGFDAFITVDRGIEHQQNTSGLPLPVIIMLGVRNRLAELQPLVPDVVDVLSGDLHRRIYRVAE